MTREPEVVVEATLVSDVAGHTTPTAIPSGAGTPASQIVTATQPPGEPIKKRVLGLDAGNWISLTALLISVGTAVWQTSGLVVGPKIQFIAPTSVTFRYWPAGERGALALTATTMNYVNEGRKDYDGLVINEVARVYIGDHSPLTLNWWWFVGPDGSATEQAHPVVVPGAGLAAHETRFAPLIQPCPLNAPCTEETAYANFLPWETFLAQTTDKHDINSIDIAFSMTVRERDERTLEYRCSVAIDSRVREKMALQLQRFAAYLAEGRSPEEIVELSGFTKYYSLPCTARQ